MGHGTPESLERGANSLENSVKDFEGFFSAFLDFISIFFFGFWGLFSGDFLRFFLKMS